MNRDEEEFWRVVNASADTIIDLQVQFDGVPQPLVLVGLDGVPTGSQDGTRRGKIVTRTDTLIPPAGRAEFIVTGPSVKVRHASLLTLSVNTGPVGDNDPQRPLAMIKTIKPVTRPLVIMPIPSNPPNLQQFEGLHDAAVTQHRHLYFSEVISDPSNPASPTNFFITVDGATPVLFDPNNPPAITTTQGSVEDWTIENRTEENHEFHMHQVHFELLKRNGVPVPQTDQQFLDVVEVPFWSGAGPYPSVRVRMDFRGMDIGDFVYHCHILGHEDNGMMAIIRVLPRS
jgi:FtsP/CotA-like multicopper oxidase with cupredoxin domain